MNNKPYEIKVYEILDQRHLKLYIADNNGPCGSIDFIADKINFNISCKRNLFKGMEPIQKIQSNYQKEQLVITLSNKETLSFKCSVQVFEQINAHIERYKRADTNQQLKDAFLKD